MAVEFLSNGYDTTVANPYTEGVWADSHPVIGLATYGVRSPLDWKVTAVAGQDRTISIGPGRGYGYGVTDYTYANETLQLDTISSGSRWDLIAVRRDWTPTAGMSQFVKVNGGATAVIPGGRITGPGNIDDQPLALVQVTAGQTQPTSIIDLRTWSGDGGGLIANHDLVRSFLNKTGTRIAITGNDWLRIVGANDTPEWVSLAPAPQYAEFTGPIVVANGGFGRDWGSFTLNASASINNTFIQANGSGTLKTTQAGTFDFNGIILPNVNGPKPGKTNLTIDANGRRIASIVGGDYNAHEVSVPAPGIYLPSGAVISFNLATTNSVTLGSRVTVAKTR